VHGYLRERTSADLLPRTLATTPSAMVKVDVVFQSALVWPRRQEPRYDSRTA
jgi:hypothetical protein